LLIAQYNWEEMTKTRYVENRTKSIMFRIDNNDEAWRIEPMYLEEIKNNSYFDDDFDAVIISDYNKGFLSPDDIKFICENNKNVFIDTKKIIGPWIKDATFIKINNEEYEKTNHTLDGIDLKDKLIITLGGKGCKYKDKIYPAENVPIKHLSGAGDTFLAGLVCEYLATEDMDKAIEFAQKCATKVIQQEGVSVV
jgi:D-beta-D-heptose 7-phosphate kinase/D-beta-D-heptose 1-phosphate adenosyltransferase